MRAAAASLLIVLLIAGCGGSAGGGSTDAGGAPTCEGSTALCGRRLDQVVFPGTHNSYAASDQPGWHFAPQRYGIGRQLDDGIRALLLDVHYGVSAPDGLVRTDFAAEGAEANKVAATLPPRVLRAAERHAGPLGARMPAGDPRLYLCHTLCELGAEPLGAELATIAAFLESHPRTFLVLVMEDYVPAARIAAAFRAAGLAQLAATLPRHAPLPTLGRLLGEGRRLVVFSEKSGGTPAWYMPAFSYIQDTPLGARAARPARLRPLPRRRRQPAAPDQPLDPALPAQPAAQRGDRHRPVPARSGAPLHAGARLRRGDRRRRLLRAHRGGAGRPRIERRLVRSLFVR